MAFLGRMISVRFNKEATNNAEELLDTYPDEFPTMSQLVRAALNFLVNDRRYLEENGHRRTKNKN